ncbi:MAG: SpoIIE family protein phosphatase [Oscillospiraceae bacterium]|nr:SpoIIE family protein phosphatase [Oscillospiraceae bacterium]
MNLVKKAKLFAAVISVILCISYMPPPARAADSAELPAIKVAMSDDQSIIIERILYEGLKRSGYQMVSRVTGMLTASVDTNYGDAAILSLQVDGWDSQYENLLKVPVVISHVEFTAYVRSEDTYTFSDWGDMAGLRVGYRLQNAYVANNVWRANAGGLVEVNTLGELWGLLLSGKADVVVAPRMNHYEHRFPQGVRRANVLEGLPCYNYVNKNYAHLIPVLEKAYREMYDDGTMALINDGKNVPGSTQTILHINSYNDQSAHERSQMEAIRQNLDADTALEYRSFNLNMNELHSQVSFNTVVSDFIRTDFVSRSPDLIIASGNDALEFVLNNYYLLFPKAPVVFFGVWGMEASMLWGHEEHITGVSETVGFSETVSEMLRLYPKTRRIFILNDYTLAKSIKLREEIQKAMESSDFPVEFIFSENKPFAGVLEDIRGFGSDALVLIGDYLADGDSVFYSGADVVRQVCEASGNPVFCLTASYIGYGTLGGLIAGTDLQSAMVASITAEILKGKSPSDIPVVYDSASFNQWQFDYETAKKFNIDLKALPEGHVPVNRVLPIWESNPREFNLMLMVGILFLLIIGGLIVLVRILAKKQKAELEKVQAETVAEVMLSSARYANKIQQNLLPPDNVFEKAFSDYSVIWNPRDIVGGDIYWVKNFDKGAVLCVCDCTGHGTPGALLTMLVASTFETLISEDNCSDTAQILHMLDQRLASVLNAKNDDGEKISMEINDGCDIVVMFIANDGGISMSAGNINVLVCDGNGVKRYKGQHIFVGEGKLKNKEEIEIVGIPFHPDNKFYIASDGLSDQIGGEYKKQFGFRELEQIILENHREKQEVISGKIWNSFEKYRGEEPRRDDFELITFKLNAQVI